MDDETRDFAQGYDKRLRYAPSTLVVFEKKEIQLSGVLNLAELLERVVGVHITRKSVGASGDQYVRGINGNWLLLHNGVEIERIVPETLSVPIVDIQRLEVLKGSHYAIYGPSAIVGTVNIVTFGPDERMTSASVRAGSLGTSEAWFRKSNVLGELGYSVYLSHLSSEGTDKVIERDRQTGIDEALGTNASFAPTATDFSREVTDARLTIEYGSNWTLHQYINDRSAGLGTGLSQSIDPTGEENLFRYTSDLRYRRRIERGSVEAQFVYNRIKGSIDDALLLPPGTLGGLFPDGVKQSYGQTGTEYTFDAITRLGFREHTIELGVGAQHGVVKNDFDRRNFTVQNGSAIPVPFGVITDTGNTGPLFDDNYTVTYYHLLFRDQWDVTPDLKLNLGVRVDNSTDYGTVINPRMSLEWKAGRSTNIYLLYGESSIVPTIIQLTSTGVFAPLGNRDLKPAKMRMIELAADSTFGPAFRVNANLFFYRQSDNIASAMSSESPNGREFVNLNGEEDGSGIDFLGQWRISDALSFKLGAAFQSSQTEHTRGSIAPTFLPYAEVTYKFKQGWDANIAVINASNRDRAEDDSRPSISDYTVVNATLLNTSLYENTSFSLSIQNLFDEDAREDVDLEIAGDIPVWPQRILIGVKYAY